MNAGWFAALLVGQKEACNRKLCSAPDDVEASLSTCFSTVF